MSACQALTAEASAGVAAALRAVDCLAAETTASAFARLFGGGMAGTGALLPALTILLTLYIAFFAVSLLTGRSSVGVAALTPRMMTLGLVLTFATSWVAYSQVVWNLAVGAPDQVAGVLMGAKASATQLFAGRIDMVFAAIAEVGEAAGQGAQGAGGQVAGGAFSPAGLMWLGAILLLLGTVGVLVTARIALAVLVTIGPVFVVMALFPGTRGLFVGWLRGVVMTALTPLFAVLGGAFMLELAVPVVVQLRSETDVDARAAMALFLIAAVHVALMVMVLKVTATMVRGWQVFGLSAREPRGEGGRAVLAAAAAARPLEPVAAPAVAASAASRRAVAAAVPAIAASDPHLAASPSSAASRGGRAVVIHLSGGSEPLPSLPHQRGRGVGSRFRPAAAQPREMLR